MLFASIFNLPLPPFPIQILWISIATDGFPALALGVFTNKKLLCAAGISFALQVAIVHSYFLKDIFKVEPLRLSEWVTVMGFASLVFVVVEILKFLTKKR